jgi:hypothetical protein
MAVVVKQVPRDRLPRDLLPSRRTPFAITADAPPIEALPLSIHHAALPPPWPLELPLPWPAFLAFELLSIIDPHLPIYRSHANDDVDSLLQHPV